MDTITKQFFLKKTTTTWSLPLRVIYQELYLHNF